MSDKRILVPRFLDRDNHNAQCLNAKALLSRFTSEGWTWVSTHYGTPDPAILNNPHVQLTPLWKRSLWQLRMWLLYMQPADALFYPGIEQIDLAGVRWRKKLYPRSPIIATLEGVAGTEAREEQLTEWAGHPVHCQRVNQQVMDRVDAILGHADHIIAISPFLAEMGRKLYGNKLSMLPLGIDTNVFAPLRDKKQERVKVVSAGTFQARKRPELFLELARRHPQADFIWYGNGGDARSALQAKALKLGIGNLNLPGAVSPKELGAAFRAADIFVMPSVSEGVPKVTQEAAACGLPVVLFGYYETPSVIDGENGFVVWNDDELFARVSELIENRELAVRMGQKGARLANAWDWDVLAPQWESAIKALIPA